VVRRQGLAIRPDSLGRGVLCSQFAKRDLGQIAFDRIGDE